MMFLQNHPQRKKIVIGLGILVVIGLALWQYQDGHRPYTTSSPSMVGEYAIYGEAGEMAARDMAVADGDDMSMVNNFAAQKVGLTTPRPALLEYESGSVAIDVPQDERLVIKNGSMSLVVESVEGAVEYVQTFALEKGGFVVTSNIDRAGIAPNGYVQVRIPSHIFDTGLNELRALGEVQSEHVDGRDVTEEYVDLEARLKNFQATEAQFLSIMKQAVDIEDILAVQRELTNVRSQIESLQARMTYLKESAAFSSLTVYLSTNPEDLPILDQGDTWKPLATVKDALRGLLDLGARVVDAIIWLVVYIPLWIVLVLIVWFGK